VKSQAVKNKRLMQDVRLYPANPVERNALPCGDWFSNEARD
jgi:hypothetical protein